MNQSSRRTIQMNNRKFILSLTAATALLFSACGDDKAPPADEALTFTKVTAGGNQHYEGTDARGAHTCAIASDGTLWCWGSGGYGQLGTGSYATSTTPVQVGTETDWIDVQAGGHRTCGIRGADGVGTLWCWGSNFKYGDNDYSDPLPGLLGLGDSFDDVIDVNEPTQVGEEDDWAQVAMANHHTCAIRDDGSDRTLWCFGSNSNGALGDNTQVDRNEPVQEDGGYTDWASVTGSRTGYESNQTCGVREDGSDRTVWCMGYQGAYGLPTQSNVPSQLGTDTDFDRISVSGDQTNCFIKTDGTLWCGSGNNHGQVGDGTFDSATPQKQVGEDETWTDVSVGQQHVCGINNGAMYCWGRDHRGELGLGADHSKAGCVQGYHGYNGLWDCTLPALADDTNTWESVSCGKGQCCGITDGGDVYCWGDNQYGATGVTTASIINTPTKVE
jgi:alpha-tubulin suppressor-like RCC1 family protein